MNYFGGFQPCSLVVLELPFLVVPLGLGLLFLYLSRRFPAALNINTTALLIVSTAILSLLVPLELYLFNGERFNLESEQITSIHGKLWLALLLIGPSAWLLCRSAIKDLPLERLMSARRKCLILCALFSICVGLAFGVASSCYGLG